jgi:hypothetical protein
MDKKKKIIIGTAVAVVIIAIAVACVLIFGSAKKEKNENTTEPEETTTVVETTTEDPNQGKTLSYLTGEYVSNKRASRRPVAVMYNNIINAIPHSGLSYADVIYEAPVEGSITRLMGIFDNYDKLKKIGSVRSSRIYYCYFALEWDAIYCHYGQSKYALSFLKSDSIDNISSYNAGNYFYRTSDRVAPHNCFTSGEEINAAIKKLGYKKKYDKDYQGHFNFAEYGSTLELESSKKAQKVEIGYPINQPWFEYNAQDGQYYRYQYGDKHIDDQNNKQLHCSNIIIQFVNSTIYPDNKSLDITLTGEGSGWYITKGKAEKITWKKAKKEGQTKYYDKSGAEITLNTGKTWICMVQSEYSDDVKISK